jgi:cell division protein FtsA
MAVGTPNENGDVTVLGIEVQKIESCVEDGDVRNHIILGDAIAKAKSALESDLGLRLNSAYVGISGRSVYCVRYEDYVDINNKTGCVTDVEMRELKARIDSVVPKSSDEIIDRILLRYCIDDRQEVEDPLGSYGRKLLVTYLYVMADRFQIDRVNRAMHRAGITNCGLCINPTLLPDLLLTPEEKEEGVAIVDIGGDLTDIAIVREGKLCYFSSLPIGSSSISNDLHTALNIPKRDVDIIKHRFGSAIAESVPEDVAISIKTASHHIKRPILKRNIAEIAEERLKDIARFIARELKSAKFSTRIPCGIVLTGGATYLSNIDQLFARELKVDVRFGDMLNGLDDASQEMVCAKPQSVAVGLLLYGAKNQACNTFTPPPAPPVDEPTPEPAPKGNKVEGVGVTEQPEHTIENVTPPTNPPTTPPESPGENDGEGGELDDTPKPEPPTPPQPPKPGIFERFRSWIDTKFENDGYL